MNSSFLHDAGIDYEAGVERFLGDAALYESVLIDFLEDDSLERAQKAYRDGDTEKLFVIAHELKGACGNMDMTALYGASSALVERLRNDRHADMEAVRGLYEAMSKAYQAAHSGIEKAR